jgi:hypothetical protein
VFEVLAEMGIPVAIQTKGGKGIDRVLELLKSPTVFYVTIETDQDEIAKRIAPGAPSITERFELIRLLRSKGHPVVVGWNPAVPEWCQDEEAHLDRLKEAGVHGVWAESLHFNVNQVKALTPREIEALTPELIKRASKSSIDDTDLDYVNWILEESAIRGLHPYSVCQSRQSGFFDAFHGTYEKTFPTMQDFINTCYEVLKPGDLLFIEDWLVLADYLPKGIHQNGHYICSTNYSLCKAIAKEEGSKWDHKMSYSDLLKKAWRHSDVKFCPAQVELFQYAVTPEDEDWVDKNGYPILVWKGEPSTGWDCIIEDL